MYGAMPIKLTMPISPARTPTILWTVVFWIPAVVLIGLDWWFVEPGYSVTLAYLMLLLTFPVSFCVEAICSITLAALFAHHPAEWHSDNRIAIGVIVALAFYVGGLLQWCVLLPGMIGWFRRQGKATPSRSKDL
jgi:hypothetical protein